MRSRALAAAVIGAALLLGAASPAHAAGPADIEFSADGSSWSQTPPAALFPSGIVLVPGDAISATVWVRNANSTPGVLVAALTNMRSDGVEPGLGFGLRGSEQRLVTEERRAFDQLVDCSHIVPSRVLAPGEEAELTFTVDLGAHLVDDQGQHGSMSFEVWFGFSDAAATAVTAFGCPSSPVVIPSEPQAPAPQAPAPSVSGAASGTLPLTGGRLALGALAAALAMGGAGWLLTTLARRTRRSE